MVDTRVIKSHTDWSSPLVLIPMADSLQELQVNALFKFATYPLPCIDKLLNWLSVA